MRIWRRLKLASKRNAGPAFAYPRGAFKAAEGGIRKSIIIKNVSIGGLAGLAGDNLRGWWSAWMLTHPIRLFFSLRCRDFVGAGLAGRKSAVTRRSHKRLSENRAWCLIVSSWRSGRTPTARSEDWVFPYNGNAMHRMNDSAWKKTRVRAANFWREEKLCPAHQ